MKKLWKLQNQTIVNNILGGMIDKGTYMYNQIKVCKQK